MPFYFFFGLLGLVVGGLVTWFVLANHPFESLETPGGPVDEVEATYIATVLAGEGMPVDEAVVARLLELHGAYVEGREPDASSGAEAAPVAGADREAADAPHEADAGLPTVEGGPGTR